MKKWVVVSAIIGAIIGSVVGSLKPVKKPVSVENKTGESANLTVYWECSNPTQTCITLKFNTNQFILDAKQREEINRVPKNCTAYFVTGYSDTFGNSYYNTKLSQYRARAVGDYLLTQGVPAKKIWTRGFGVYTDRIVKLCCEE